jgi:hypothetical protein
METVWSFIPSLSRIGMPLWFEISSKIHARERFCAWTLRRLAATVTSVLGSPGLAGVVTPAGVEDGRDAGGVSVEVSGEGWAPGSWRSARLESAWDSGEEDAAGARLPSSVRPKTKPSTPASTATSIRLKILWRDMGSPPVHKVKRKTVLDMEA